MAGGSCPRRRHLYVSALPGGGLARADDRGGRMLVDAVGLANLDVLETSGAEEALVLLGRERAGDAASPLAHVNARGLVHVGVGYDVGDGEPATRPKDARGLAEHLGLIAGEIDHAVGDDDVDRAVGQWDLLEIALAELDVLDARL